jgi:hypothetical protein
MSVGVPEGAPLQEQKIAVRKPLLQGERALVAQTFLSADRPKVEGNPQKVIEIAVVDD